MQRQRGIGNYEIPNLWCVSNNVTFEQDWVFISIESIIVCSFLRSVIIRKHFGRLIGYIRSKVGEIVIDLDLDETCALSYDDFNGTIWFWTKVTTLGMHRLSWFQFPCLLRIRYHRLHKQQQSAKLSNHDFLVCRLDLDLIVLPCRNVRNGALHRSRRKVWSDIHLRLVLSKFPRDTITAQRKGAAAVGFRVPASDSSPETAIFLW